jgi:hypothetical protein
MNFTERKNYRQSSATRFFTLIICIAAMTINSMAQKSFNLMTQETPQLTPAPTPIQNPDGNGFTTCEDLNYSRDYRFTHILLNNELKLDFSPPAGTSSYSFINNNAGLLVMPLSAQNSNSSISITRTGNSFDFITNKVITAVIVKGGSISNGGGVNVYSYPTGTQGSAGLTTVNAQFGISHISFCFQASFAPTSAKVNVGGQVINGKRGIANAQVYLTDQNGETKIAMTNSLGYYQFADVRAGETYVLNVFSKRYTFSPQVLTVNEDLTELNLVAEF